MPPERGEATGQRSSDASDPRRRRLADLAESLGETVATAGNQPVRLDDPESVWFVERGVLDIFFVYAEGGIAEAPFHHALRLEEGRLAFGAGCTEETLGLPRFSRQYKAVAVRVEVGGSRWKQSLLDPLGNR